MIVRPLKLDGTFEVELSPKRDARGHFMRGFDAAIWEAHGLPATFVQENEAFTKAKHTLRGLHFQRPPHAETKIVRCVAGAVYDVFVDLRAGSPTYGQWDGHVLNAAAAPRWLVIPKGFAHGYCTLTDDTLFAYKVDAAYAPDAEGGLAWDDPALAIPWPARDPLVSPRDAAHPRLADLVTPFVSGIAW
jgi:dTDP-4-dehydrorhamnose 3,5-epimerase